MKLQDLFESDLPGGWSKRSVLRHICATFGEFIDANIRSPMFNTTWQLAMKHCPEYIYQGKMYRGLAVTGDNPQLIELIRNKDHRQILRYIKNPGHSLYSFTTDIEIAKEYATEVWGDETGSIVIEQVSRGVDLNALLKGLYPKVFNGRTFPLSTDAESNKEILAPLDQNCRIISISTNQQQ